MAGSPHSHNTSLPPPPPPAAVVRNVSPGPPPLRGPASSSSQFPMPYMALPPSQVPGSGPPRYPMPPFSQPPRAMYRPSMALPPSSGGVAPRPSPLGAIIPRPLKPPGILPDPIAKAYGAPFDKPFTTVYVGKIASTVDDTFLRSILQLCGPIKSWKRAHDPTAGGPKGFGFCEFETAEGVLRALRLLNKYNLDGQELVLNVNKDTREYLERYVAGKENDRLLEEAAQEEDMESAPGVEVSRKKAEQSDNPKAFGIVSEMDKKGDEDALARLKTLIEERVRCRPLFRSLTLDGRSPSTRERSKDLDDMNGRNEDDHSSERLERMEPSSSDMIRRDREQHRERDDERHERVGHERRERPRHNMIKDRKQQQHRDMERTLEELEREWEAREREKERQRLHDKERERERERERRREVKEQEEESDNEGKKKRYRPDERRRRRQREREDDIADAIREAEEIAEAKRRKLEVEMVMAQQERIEADESREDVKMEIDSENESPSVNGESEAVSSEAARNDAEAKPIPKKLGFGISGSGKRASLPAVFHQADDEDLSEDRKLRPLVPIDYSAEEMQAVRLRRSTSPEDGRKESRRKSRRDREKEREESNQKALDAKALIDSIPKSKEELFSYEINWAIYDKHKLHEKMKPWISKKIKEFMGEEEASFVDFIVSDTCKHVSAADMLQKLKSILDEEAEMFVLKMWRMLIFEIRRVETGLAKALGS